MKRQKLKINNKRHYDDSAWNRIENQDGGLVAVAMVEKIADGWPVYRINYFNSEFKIKTIEYRAKNCFEMLEAVEVIINS